MPIGLPPGLRLEALSGVVSGSPTAAGTYTVPLVVRDGVGNSRAFNGEVDILNFVPPQAVSSFSAGDAQQQFLTVGVSAQWAFAITTVAGQQITAVTASIVPASPGLPPGVALGATGIGPGGFNAFVQCTGTPTATIGGQPYGRRRFVVQLNWTILRGAESVSGFTRFQINAQYQPQMTVEGQYGLVIVNQQNSMPLLRGDGSPGIQGGHEPRRVTLGSGSQLPAGLSINSTTGAIVGSPVQIGTWPIDLVVRDAAGNIRALDNVQLRTDIIYEPPQFVGLPGNTSQSFEREAGAFTLLPDYSAFRIRAFLPFQLEWVRTSGSTDITPVAPSSLSTGFTCNVPPGQSRSTVFRIDIWDERTPRGQVQSVPITIAATNAYTALTIDAVPVVTVGGTRKIVGGPFPYSALVPLVGGVRPYGQISIGTPALFGNIVATARPADGAVLFAGGDGQPVLPAQAGVAQFAATVVDGNGTPRSIGRTVRCVDPPVISGPAGPAFRVGVASTAQFLANQGNREAGGGQAFSLSAAPPGGLSFTSSGLAASIAGTPTTPGSTPLTLTYRDGLIASQYTNETQAAITVLVAAAITISFDYVGSPPAVGDPFVVDITPSPGASIVEVFMRDVAAPVIPALPGAPGATITVSGTRLPQSLVQPHIVATANDTSGAPAVTNQLSFP